MQRNRRDLERVAVWDLDHAEDKAEDLGYYTRVSE